MYPVVSASGVGGVQVKWILVESFPITALKLLGAEATVIFYYGNNKLAQVMARFSI